MNPVTLFRADRCRSVSRRRLNQAPGVYRRSFPSLKIKSDKWTYLRSRKTSKKNTFILLLCVDFFQFVLKFSKRTFTRRLQTVTRKSRHYHPCSNDAFYWFPGPHHRPPTRQQIPALQTRHGHLHREPLCWSSVLQVGDLSG